MTDDGVMPCDLEVDIIETKHLSLGHTVLGTLPSSTSIMEQSPESVCTRVSMGAEGDRQRTGWVPASTSETKRDPLP